MNRVVGDSWYAQEIESWAHLDDVVPRRWRGLVERSGFARGVALTLAARGPGTVVVTTNPSPGASTAIVLLGLLGWRRLVLLEYIVHPPTWSEPFHRLYFLLVRRLLLRRALSWAQVLTRREIGTYAVSHQIPEPRFVFVPWPGRYDDSPVGPVQEGRRVLASGRRTDWATFFAAADGADWEVHVVCADEDRTEVERLSRRTDAVVRSEISVPEHQREVDQAAVYVVPLYETGSSVGQIRIMNAAQAGTALVLSDVRGIEDYVDDGCAVIVPPDDPVAIRKAVDDLLDDPERRTRMRDALRTRGTRMKGYLALVGDLVARL